MKKSLWLMRVAVVFAVCSLTIVNATGVFGATLSEIQKEKEAAQKEKADSESKLESVQGDIEEISGEKEAVEEEIEVLDSLLLDLLIEVDLLGADIEDKKAAIEESKLQYANALEVEETQKEAMAKRIKYMYEKGNESYLEILIESKSMAEAVNKVEYAEKLYTYDRILLEKYQFAKQQVAEKEAQLEADLSELEELEEDLVIQQDELNALIAEKEATVENFAAQLSKAKAAASEYEKQIKAQSDNLKRINQEEQEKIAEEARKKAEEEARKKAEEAARKKAEEDAKKNALDLVNPSKNSDESSLEPSKTDSTTDSTTATTTDSATAGSTGTSVTSASGTDSTSTATGADAGQSSSQTSSSTTSSGTSVTASGSGIGAQIANYGLQFVGNPYVAGGTSLTDGCDCSGFTQEVYAHFGIKIPRSSYAQSEGGTAIDYSAIQAGDIIYYGGHVAIYIGNDQIVHASTPSTGIKISSAFYRSIITIRRYY